MHIVFLFATLLGKGQNTSNGAVHDTSIGVTAMETGTIADLKKGVKSSGKQNSLNYNYNYGVHLLE